MSEGIKYRPVKVIIMLGYPTTRGTAEMISEFGTTYNNGDKDDAVAPEPAIAPGALNIKTTLQAPPKGAELSCTRTVLASMMVQECPVVALTNASQLPP